LSKEWVTKIGGNIHPDFSHITFQTIDGDNFILYAEASITEQPKTRMTCLIRPLLYMMGLKTPISYHIIFFLYEEERKYYWNL
jgi:hypothetical protein